MIQNWISHERSIDCNTTERFADSVSAAWENQQRVVGGGFREDIFCRCEKDACRADCTIQVAYVGKISRQRERSIHDAPDWNACVLPCIQPMGWKGVFQKIEAVYWKALARCH